MSNLKKIGKTIKGQVGELLFKEKIKNLILTQFSSFDENNLMIFEDFQLDFLRENWNTIDAISFNDEVILYEIKTKNWYKFYQGYKIKQTLNADLVYKKAIKMGFKVKIGLVYFFSNWNYSIKIIDYNSNFFSIHRPNKYDKLEYAYNKK